MPRFGLVHYNDNISRRCKQRNIIDVKPDTTLSEIKSNLVALQYNYSVLLVSSEALPSLHCFGLRHFLSQVYILVQPFGGEHGLKDSTKVGNTA